MPPTCTICRHPPRAAIEQTLVAGEPFRHIAARFDTSTGALQRHKPHMGQALAKAQAHREEQRGQSVLDQLKTLHEKVMAVLEDAERTKAPKLMLAAVKEARGNLTFWAELMATLKVTEEGSRVLVEYVKDWRTSETDRERRVFMIPNEIAHLFKGRDDVSVAEGPGGTASISVPKGMPIVIAKLGDLPDRAPAASAPQTQKEKVPVAPASVTPTPSRKRWASADDLDVMAGKARGKAGAMGPRRFGPPE